MRNTIKVAIAALAILGLSACGQPTDTPTNTTSSDSAGTSTSEFKACMVSDQGGFDDKSFNQSGYEGLQRAKSELGVQTANIESQTDADFGPNVKNMVDQGCDIIVTVGFMLGDATRESATANPNVHYALVDSTLSDADGNPITLDNVRPLVFNTAEADFLAGYLAASVSQTGKVATFGGQNIPSVTIFMDGFADGVAYYNEQKNANVEVLGWDKASQTGSFVGDFENTNMGQSLSQGFIDQGADIIHPVAGPVGVGALAAAREAGNTYVIWVDADGAETNPEYSDIILTSVVKEIGAAVFDTIKTSQAGEFTAENYVGNLANGGVSLAPFHEFDSKISAETKAELEEIKQGIIDGTIKVESPSSPV
jgi:basic membrane protein A